MEYQTQNFPFAFLWKEEMFSVNDDVFVLLQYLWKIFFVKDRSKTYYFKWCPDFKFVRK